MNSPPTAAEAIRALAIIWKAMRPGRKLPLPAGLCERVRALGAWDDQAFQEQPDEAA